LKRRSMRRRRLHVYIPALGDPRETGLAGIDRIPQAAAIDRRAPSAAN